MRTETSQYMETSVPVGALFLAIGLATWGAQYVHGIFTGWLFAIATGGLWVTFGVLFLFPDVRLYQYDQSPVEQLLTESSAEESTATEPQSRS